MFRYIKKFDHTSLSDIAEVGGRCASLGEIYSQLRSKGISVSNGFAVTAFAFRHFIDYNKLNGVHKKLINKLDRVNYSNLTAIGKEAREIMLNARMPDDLGDAVIKAYHELYDNNRSVVTVQSSVVIEDFPEENLEGQHEVFCNINGDSDLLLTVKQCFSTLYADSVIKCLVERGKDHYNVAVSACIQLMIHTDNACSGVCFTLEPESGFRNAIYLAGGWGLSESIIQNEIGSDEFLLFKPALRNNRYSILKKKLGSKLNTIIYASELFGASRATQYIATSVAKQTTYVLNDEEIVRLGKWALLIEDHYRLPMDIAWAKEGGTGELYIIKALPETVHSRARPIELKEYQLLEKSSTITFGQAIGAKITSGKARVLGSPLDGAKLNQGDILIAPEISSAWNPILNKVSAIVTDRGGRSSYASIIAHKLGVPAVVGTENATQLIKDGEEITVDCAEGKSGSVYRGVLKWREDAIDLSEVYLPDLVKVMLILDDPERAFHLAAYPSKGVGLLSVEFIISHSVQVHPMALAKFETLEDEVVRAQIEEITKHCLDKEQYFVAKLAEGVAVIAAAFYPREVIVRMSDFKANEYANLVGGKDFEPSEANPMIGFRGASRYFNDRYREGFQLECRAIKYVRDDMGLDNVKLMIPFCRTPEEGRLVVDLMNDYGLRQGENNLEIYLMAEIPSNVLLASEFAKIFDGFVIDSDDLMQLSLGIDRDSSLIPKLFDEESTAAKAIIKTMIKEAITLNRKIGICGQAPSYSESFASFLLDCGIQSISFNPDALIKGLRSINKNVPIRQECPDDLGYVFNNSSVNKLKI